MAKVGVKGLTVPIPL